MMSNNNKKKSSFRAFMSRNGFYIALVVCVIAAAIASYSAISSILDNLRTEDSPTQQTPNPPPSITTPEVEPEPPEQAEPEDTPTVSDDPGVPQRYNEDPDEEVSAVTDPVVPVYSQPLTGTMTNGFSGDELVRSVTMNDWRTHNGVDYAAAAGTPVTAIFSGEILRAGVDSLLGNFVEQKLDSGYVVIYANLGPISGIKAGDRISQGAQIGTVGSSAILENGEPPHLHLEVKSGDKYIDPLSIFK